jgi:polyisoprenoid-binding protein YceI
MSTQMLATDVHAIDMPDPGMWLIDEAHSTVGFAARHLMISNVRGRFSSFTGSIHVAADPRDSTVDVTIDAASIDTGNADRDTHLRSADFLHVEKYPFITFNGRGVEVTGPHSFRLPGHLTIRDVTLPITLGVEYEGMAQDASGTDRAAFTATAAIDRDRFGLTWNAALETGGVVVGNRVQIEIEIEAVRQDAEDRAS